MHRASAGDFAPSGYGFYTSWFDAREQWKTDEFKAGLDEVINALREDKGLLHNRYEMAAFARKNPESAFQGSYCAEYGFRADTEKHAFLLRCNPTKGDYNFYCYCYVKEWLDKHMARAEQGIRFIDPHYKELFRIPDGGKIIITYDWGEKRKKAAVSLTNTIPKWAAISTTSASLSSVWKGTGIAANRSRKSRRRRRKPRSRKTMSDRRKGTWQSTRKPLRF